MEVQPLPESEQDLMPIILKIAPGFQQKWEKHLEHWKGEPASIYNDITEFSHYFVDSYDKGDTSWYGAFFELVERMIVEGNDHMKELAVIGFLETIQTIASWRPHEGKVFTKWLGRKSRDSWRQIDKLWSQQGSLANIIRAEKRQKQ